MAVFNCKMCGGDLEVRPDERIAVCEYCGAEQTLPNVNDGWRANAFNLANKYRRKYDFDKAITVYKDILSDNATDAEAHWGIVLSRFGIEYVEDSISHKRIPTCHRMQIASVLTDEDYLDALENAPDKATKELYEKEASYIAEIQKGILDIANREKPYDVFICYKETDDSGARSKDSVLAQEIYDQLTDDGYKVFFSHVTLEDKLEQEYEPYIFAALNSAKVMVVVGTSKENFNAVWVRNEWSRYLDLMNHDMDRLLIPCYCDMNANDIPDELSMLQCQDMSKKGFIQDFASGIKNVLQNNGLKAADVTKSSVDSVSPDVISLCKHGNLFLEDSDWQSADEYFGRALDKDPKFAMAYVGKLCAELQVRSMENLAESEAPFDDNNNYKKAICFADEELKKKLMDINEQSKLVGICSEDMSSMNPAKIKESSEEVCIAETKHKKKFAKNFLSVAVCIFAAIVLMITVVIPTVEYCKAVILLDEGKKAEAAITFSKVIIYKKAKERSMELWAEVTQRDTISAGRENTVGLKAYDSVVAVGKNIEWKYHISKWTDIIAVSAGNFYTLGLKSDGTVVASGYNDYGRCDVHKWKDIVAISAGDNHTVGLKSNGTVVAVGSNDYGECDVSDWKDIIAISTGINITVGLKTDGTVVAVGRNDYGQCDVSKWKDIIAVSTGGNHTVGVKEDGTVVAVGDNADGECDVSDWSGIFVVSAGVTHTVGMKKDGTVVAVGANNSGQCNVSSWSWENIVAISAGGFHTVGLKADGTVVATGADEEDQCKAADWCGIKVPKN